MLSAIPWILAFYGIYKLGRWVKKKNLQRAYENWFLRELGKEICGNPDEFERLFPGLKGPE